MSACISLPEARDTSPAHPHTDPAVLGTSPWESTVPVVATRAGGNLGAKKHSRTMSKGSPADGRDDRGGFESVRVSNNLERTERRRSDGGAGNLTYSSPEAKPANAVKHGHLCSLPATGHTRAVSPHSSVA